MRPAVLFFLLFVVSGYAANAQFTILPQAGIENPLTRINYNNLPSFVPLQNQLSVNMGLRLDYKIKKIGQGPYLSLSTSRMGVSYDFTNPETGMSVYTSNMADVQLRIEGGWQLTTKPIYFKKPSSNISSQSSKAVSTKSGKSSGCGSYTVAKTHCGNKKKTEPAKKPQSKGTFVRIMPSVGLGYIPSAKPEVVSKNNGGQLAYSYAAGSNRTALVAGSGFEIGKGNRRIFTLSINYLQGLGDNKSTFTSMQGTKSVTTTLDSKVRGWNTTIGIPISLTRKPATKTKSIQKTKSYDCQKYKIQKVQYKSGCRKSI